MRITAPDIEHYCRDRTRRESPALAALAAETNAALADPGMMCGPIEGTLLRILVQAIGARRVLEIGTFTGYSALSMAEGLPDGGEVVTCELDPAHATAARRLTAASPHGCKIRVHEGPALQTLSTLRGPFDLAFIDADKRGYAEYYETALALLRPGGLIAIDNALWSGGVLAPSDEAGRTIDALNRRIETDPRVEGVLLPIRDGLHLARKR